MGCGSTVAQCHDALPMTGETSQTVDVEPYEKGFRVLTQEENPRVWMQIAPLVQASKNQHLWINGDSPINPCKLHVQLETSSGKSVVEGKIDEDFDIKRILPVFGSWPEDSFAAVATWPERPEIDLPKCHWKSTPHTLDDHSRYVWKYAREMTVKIDTNGELESVASLKVKVSGITRVSYGVASGDLEKTRNSEKTRNYEKSRASHRSGTGDLEKAKTSEKTKCCSAMASVVIELIKEGGAVVKVDAGSDGWNEGSDGEDMKSLADVGPPKVSRMFQCELFDAVFSGARSDFKLVQDSSTWIASVPVWKEQKCKIHAKQGFPEVHSIFIASVLAFGMHPGMMMEMMNRRVAGRHLDDAMLGEPWKYKPQTCEVSSFNMRLKRGKDNYFLVTGAHHNNVLVWKQFPENPTAGNTEIDQFQAICEKDKEFKEFRISIGGLLRVGDVLTYTTDRTGWMEKEKYTTEERDGKTFLRTMLDRKYAVEDDGQVKFSASPKDALEVEFLPFVLL